jgi:hypothetical protein
MIKFTVSLFVALIFSTTVSKAQAPSYREVIYKFFSTYDIGNTNAYPLFQKKKEGWFVAKGSYSQPESFSTPQIFWSVKQGNYQPLNYSKAPADTVAINQSIINYWQSVGGDYEEYNFARNKYYGYPGWDWDEINEMTIEKTVNDTLLESLGRAYSNYASGFVIEQYGNHFENNDPDRSTLPDSVAISASRIKKFIHYEKKSWEAYEKLLKINPGYQTRVGNIALKLANEHLFLYSDLQMTGDTIDALKALEGVHYPDSILQLYKSCLNSLGKNAIIIAGGDNDTYVMWYLQEKQGIRKDVTVLNISLLGLRRYLKMLDDYFKGGLFSTKSDVYYKNNFDYFFYSAGKPDLPVEAGEFVDHLNHYDYKDPLINKLPDQVYKGEKIKYYFTTKVFFKKKKAEEITSKMQQLISLSPGYLTMNQFMLIDIISSNLDKRPIYFSYKEPLVSNLLEESEYNYMLNVE